MVEDEKIVFINGYPIYKKPVLQEKSKKVFMPIGKVASVSIRKSLTEPLVFATKDEVKRLYSSWGIVAVIRNPYDRLVSTYSYFKETPGKTGLKFRTFEEFIAAAYDSPDDATNCHVRSQLGLLSYDNKLLPNILISYENINSVKDHLPISKLIWEDFTRSKHQPWEEYYTDKLAQMVEERFAGDFELYNMLNEEN